MRLGGDPPQVESPALQSGEPCPSAAGLAAHNPQTLAWDAGRGKARAAMTTAYAEHLTEPPACHVCASWTRRLEEYPEGLLLCGPCAEIVRRRWPVVLMDWVPE